MKQRINQQQEKCENCLKNNKEVFQLDHEVCFTCWQEITEPRV